MQAMFTENAKSLKDFFYNIMVFQLFFMQWSTGKVIPQTGT